VEQLCVEMPDAVGALHRISFSQAIKSEKEALAAAPPAETQSEPSEVRVQTEQITYKKANIYEKCDNSTP